MFWTAFFLSAALHYSSHSFVNKSYSTYLTIGCFLYFSFYNSYFISNRRYLKIYEEFKDEIENSRRKSVFTLIIILVLPLLLIMGAALYWHNML